MLKNFIKKFLSVYDNESFLLQQKAKLFFSICIIVMIFIVLLPLHDIFIINNFSINFIGPLLGGFLSAIFLLFLLKRGYFYLSANGIVISVTAMLWLIMFLDEYEPLSRVDSISYILAIMTIASLAVTRRAYGILFYAFINIICLLIFVLYHSKLGLFSNEALIDYFIDNTGSIFIISVICHQFYSITNRALEKAEDEINRNIGLNRELDAKVKDRTKELEFAMTKLSETNKKLVDTGEKLWSEMELAHKIQTMLLPDKPTIPGYTLDARMQPAEEIGGDYYDVINIDGTHWVLIGDVSGHGVPAGLIMMMAQTSVQTMVREHPDLSPADLLKSVNRAIAYNMGKFEDRKFMTITALKFNQNLIEYAGFHENILVYRKKEKKVECIHTRGMWLGVPFVSPYQDEVSNISLDPGDVILLYTDGITEAFVDKTENQLGVEGLVSIFEKYGEESPNYISSKIIEKLTYYEIYDDISILVIKKNDE